MDFYLTDANGKRVHFPWNPEKVSANTGARMVTLDTIALGEIEIPKGTKNARITWAWRFPGTSRQGLSFIKDWRPPGDIVADLTGWRNAGAQLRLLITETPLNLDVYIADLQHGWGNGQGDCEYSITLAQAKPVRVYTDAEWQQLPATPTVTAVVSRPTPTPPATYTVAPGDVLWAIAKRTLGDGSRWPDIYNANASIIGPDSNVLAVGITLRIPGGGVAS